jgi:hypothetical protein
LSSWINGLWYFPSFWCPEFTWRYLADSVRPNILQILPAANPDPNTLYMYARGGPRVWEYGGDIHPSYGQPPCDYYLQVMRNFSKSVVIGDKMNPCVNITIAAGAAWEPFDDTGNLALMIQAKRIVLARSSRSHAILALSPIWKQFWMFDVEQTRWAEGSWWRGFTPLEFGDGQNCVANERYREAIGDWHALRYQVEFVLNSTCTFQPMDCQEGIVCPIQRRPVNNT